MTTTATQPDRLENETENYARAMDLADRAEAALDEGDMERFHALTALAQVRATLSLAADTDRVAGCVPEGTSKFGVVVAGGR